MKFLKNYKSMIILLTFIILGAVIGNDIIQLFGQYAILGCSFLLTLAYIFMFDDRENREKILEN